MEALKHFVENNLIFLWASFIVISIAVIKIFIDGPDSIPLPLVIATWFAWPNSAYNLARRLMHL